MLAPDEKDVVAGAVDHVDVDGVLYLRGGVGAEGIRFTRDATFWRDHPVNLSDFVPGDLVAAEGERRSDRFVANYLTSVYVARTGRLVGEANNLLRTSDSVMRLTRDSYVREEDGVDAAGLADLSEGDEIVALGRDDPELGFVAIAVSVRSDG